MSEFSAVEALLELIADPALYKAKLVELKAATEAAATEKSAAMDAKQKAANEIAASKSALAAIEKERRDAMTEANARTREMAQREASLNAREDRIKRREQEIDEQAQRLAMDRADTETKLAEAIRLRDTAAREEAAAGAARRDLDERLARIKAAAA